MKLSELANFIEYLMDEHEYDEEVFDPEIEIHQQESWPLKSRIANIRMLDDKLVIAAGCASEYGSKEAWQEA